MDSALAGALLGAVIGVLGTYVFDVRKTQRARVEREQELITERARERSAVATAIIQDLREIESLFTQLYETPTPTRAVIARPQRYYDSLRAETRWFAPKSIYPVAEVFRLADQYFSSFAQLRAISGGPVSSTPQREFELRANAGFILRALPAALAALQEEGGMLEDPDPRWKAVQFPDLPDVPAPVFAQTRARIEQNIRDLASTDR
jgi:hypothetical protein